MFVVMLGFFMSIWLQAADSNSKTSITSKIWPFIFCQLYRHVCRHRTPTHPGGAGPGCNPPCCRSYIMDAPTVVVLVGVLTLSSFLLDSCCSCKLNATMASIISIDGLASQKTDHGLRTPEKGFFSTYPKCFGQLDRLAK